MEPALLYLLYVSGWNRSGSAMWQEFDTELRPAGKPSAEAVPAWGRATAYAESNDDFVILR